MHKLKKISIIYLVIFTITTSVFAQEFNAGIYGGLSATQIDGDTFDGYNKAGIMTGAYVNRYFDKKWAGQMGLRFAQKGSKRADNEEGIYYRCQLNYIEMPLTIRYQHFKKVDFEAGLSLGYLIKAMEAIGADDMQEPNLSFNKFELASLIGINYHFNKKVFVGGHISYSLLAIRPFSSGNDEFMDKGQHNNVIYFSVGYKLSTWR